IQRGQTSLGQDPNKYYFATTTVSFVSRDTIEKLYRPDQNGQRAAKEGQLSPGFQMGGPGQFSITAASLDLGSSRGIISWGIGNGTPSGALDYASLGGVTRSGASLSVDVTGNLNMYSSTIATYYGGD